MNRKVLALVGVLAALFATAGCTGRQKSFSVDLPVTDNPVLMPDADKQGSLVVTITKDNKLFLGADPITPDGFTGKVKERLSPSVQKKVYMKVDARARYGNVVEVFDDLRIARVAELGVLTKQSYSGKTSGETEAGTPKGLEVLVADRPAPGRRTIIVQALKGFGQIPALKINQDDVVWANLEQRLSDIFNTRAEKMMFVQADDELPFEVVAGVIDMGHSAGATVVIVTAKPEQGLASLDNNRVSGTEVAGVLGGVQGGTPPGGVLGSAIAGSPTAAPGVTTPQRIRVSQGVMAGLLVTKVQPVYPPLARNARIQGTVVLQAMIGKDGSVQNLRVISGHPMLAPAAVDAVKQWRYKPYYLNGEPVEVESVITVNFPSG